MHISVVLGLPLMGILSLLHPSEAATCTITKYDEDEIANAARDCSDITVNGIEVPAGVTLNLNLKQGAKLTFQGTITFGYYEWKGPLVNVSGSDVEILGAPGHVLDGKGSLWWNGKGEYAGNPKPVLFVLSGVKNGIIHNITTKNTPFHAYWIEYSDGVIARDFYIDSKDGDALGKCTDGFNIWTSNNVTIEHISVYNQDDCIAVKSGTNIYINDIYCSGGHGLSIGSVGGRDYNIAENVFITNVTIEDSDNGVRIKTGYEATGSVTNVTYKDIMVKDINKYGIIIEGDYDIPTGTPTGIATDGVPIKHFILENVKGTVKESGTNIYVLVKNASNWSWSDIDITGAENHPNCEGIPEDSEGVFC